MTPHMNHEAHEEQCHPMHQGHELPPHIEIIKRLEKIEKLLSERGG